MSLFGGFRSSAVQGVRSCSKRILTSCEAGPSRLSLEALAAWNARKAGNLRCFNTSTVMDFPPTQPLRYPRWVNNTRQPPPKLSTEDSSEGHDPNGTQEVRMDGTDDGQAPPQSSAPPSSSSSSSGDGSDGSGSDPPPTPPPDPPSQPQTSISKQSVPEVYPEVLALPIARRPLFPGFYKAVVVRNPAVVAAIKEMMKRGQPYLGAFLLKDEHADSDVITDIDSVHPVGVFAQITSVFAANTGPGKEGLQEEGLTAVLYPHRRIKITDLIKAGGTSTVSVEAAEEAPKDAVTEEKALPPIEGEQALDVTPPTPPESTPSSPVLTAQKGDIPAPTLLQTSFLQQYDISIVHVENLVTEPYNKDNQYIRAFMSEIVSVFKDIAQLNPLFRDQITNFSINQVASNVFDEPDKLADFAAAVSTGEVGELQDVLESLVVEDRLRKSLLVLKKELINAQLQSKLSRDVDSKIAKRQREYYLMEQLKGIKKELGMESDGKDKIIEKFKERAAVLKMPEGVKKVFDEELNKLMHLEPAASEANVTRNYLEWLTQVSIIPFNSRNLSLNASIYLDPMGSTLYRELFHCPRPEGA